VTRKTSPLDYSLAYSEIRFVQCGILPCGILPHGILPHGILPHGILPLHILPRLFVTVAEKENDSARLLSKSTVQGTL